MDSVFEVTFTQSALRDLHFLRTVEQRLVVAGIERESAAEPLRETRNRKPLRPNDLSAWELRLGRFRVFYDVEEEERLIRIKAIGWKEGNTLFIGGEEFRL